MAGILISRARTGASLKCEFVYHERDAVLRLPGMKDLTEFPITDLRRCSVPNDFAVVGTQRIIVGVLFINLTALVHSAIKR